MTKRTTEREPDTKSVNSDKCVTPYENLPEGVMLNFPTLFLLYSSY